MIADQRGKSDPKIDPKIQKYTIKRADPKIDPKILDPKIFWIAEKP